MIGRSVSRRIANDAKRKRKRGAAIVWTAVALTVIFGFTALSVDIGYIYTVRTQLQCTADAAAMAAASQLASEDPSHQTVYDAARHYAQQNKAGGITVQLADSDIVLGRAVVGDGGRCTFDQGAEPPDAVKVTARLTSDSPSGALPLFFGAAFGADVANLTASAVAMLVPRDIAVVIDLSNSMSYDSQLKHEDDTEINIREVWEDLGSPVFGNMTVFHDNAEQMPIYSPSYYTSSQTKTALGLNGVPYPYPGGSWDDYIYYVRSVLRYRHDEEYRYRYRFGLRTWVHYLLDRRPNRNETPALADTREQPTYAVKQAVEELCNFLLLLDSNDHMSLHYYSDNGGTNHHLTAQFPSITQAVYQQQAGGYGRYTNIYAGIEEAIDELTSSYARSTAKKVIFILTDGNANRPGGTTTGQQYALNAADHAASLNIQIYTITLGSQANQSLMAQIATIGEGIHYHVPTFDIAQYADQLKDVFRTLGGKRPIRLIE